MNIKKYLPLFAVVFLMFGGCTAEKTSTEKIRDIEFTVLDKEEIPQEFKDRIEEAQADPLKLSYAEGGYLYIAEGYGRQSTSGYSIEVKAVYETENAVYIRTELTGPPKDEEIVEKATYPYVVVKIEYREKHIVFE